MRACAYRHGIERYGTRVFSMRDLLLVFIILLLPIVLNGLYTIGIASYLVRTTARPRHRPYINIFFIRFTRSTIRHQLGFITTLLCT